MSVGCRSGVHWIARHASRRRSSRRSRGRARSSRCPGRPRAGRGPGRRGRRARAGSARPCRAQRVRRCRPSRLVERRDRSCSGMSSSKGLSIESCAWRACGGYHVLTPSDGNGPSRDLSPCRALVDELVGELVVLPPYSGVGHRAERPGEPAGLEAELAQRGVLDPVLAPHLLHHQLGVGDDLDLGDAELARAPEPVRAAPCTRRRCSSGTPIASPRESSTVPSSRLEHEGGRGRAGLPRAPPSVKSFDAHRQSFRRDVEDDALGERQLAREVDGRGLAAHVRLPRVGARLAAAAGLLLAAEGAADLGAARADVHVRDPAVGARGREEPLGLPQVGGEDRRREPLRDAVLERDRLLRVGVREHVEDRARRSPARTTAVCAGIRTRVGLAYQASGHSSASARSPPATTSPPSALRLVERLLEPREGVAGDERADERARLAGIADGDALVGGREPADELVGDRLVHDQAAQARAPLPGGADRREEDAADDEVEVGARRHDRGVVAAELEQRAAEARGDARGELLPHRRRARRRDERQARIVGELHRAVGAADHELGEPVRHAAEPLRRPLEAATCRRAQSAACARTASRSRGRRRRARARRSSSTPRPGS